MCYKYVEGFLERNENGRWEFCDKTGEFVKEYTCGSSIEFYFDSKWNESSIEAMEDYYIVGYKHVGDLSGLNVRERIRVWD